MTGEPPNHPVPYPSAGDDPRPWWFRQFEERLLDEIRAIKKDVGELKSDRSTRQGVAVTWRGAAMAVGAGAAMLTIIVLLVTLIERLPQ